MKHKIAYCPTCGGFGLTEAGVRLGRKLSGKPNWGGVRLPDEGGYHFMSEIYDIDVPRHDPVLIRVIESLGVEAGGSVAIEVIEGDCYWIEDYDGHETVHTPETIEWVTIHP